MAKIDPKVFLRDKRFWFASILIVWAAGLQGHMMWLQKQDSFKQKFGDPDQSGNNVKEELVQKKDDFEQEWGNDREWIQK